MKIIYVLFLGLLCGCERSVFDALLAAQESSPSALQSSVLFTGTPIADGVTPVHVLVTLKDKLSNPLSNRQVQMNVSGSGNSVSICPNTNQLGQSNCRIESTWAEVKTVTVTSGISMVSSLTFLQPAASQMSAAIVVAGGNQTTPAGNIVNSAVGTVESPNRISDLDGNLRLNSSVLGSTGEE